MKFIEKPIAMAMCAVLGLSLLACGVAAKPSVDKVIEGITLESLADSTRIQELLKNEDAVNVKLTYYGLPAEGGNEAVVDKVYLAKEGGDYFAYEEFDSEGTVLISEIGVVEVSPEGRETVTLFEDDPAAKEYYYPSLMGQLFFSETDGESIVSIEPVEEGILVTTGLPIEDYPFAGYLNDTYGIDGGLIGTEIMLDGTGMPLKLTVNYFEDEDAKPLPLQEAELTYGADFSLPDYANEIMP